ncbi:MAG: nitrilase-related carbon-nitrogen hydrolase [Armatimonadota bacterium]|nr:nitrilase-related carbon-nitrogen hydrolase [Armatimonadota bacterium]MDR7401819.1 nitrilase-related carbon-nitrogen hydrolase [Armatimonadota bacterium]MDR7403121.1 nitrilase-related carbon-nitrogen hydrolase [Armatimonadota bacterium]MDR7438146.1 nitrilase-related carbon-nitrogen hydrolase [Armatimonadota bacterium]MDR7471445.1 nitrilase-related carbon-nitrogen hydrolase [Armatimonadota bacterium]
MDRRARVRVGLAAVEAGASDPAAWPEVIARAVHRVAADADLVVLPAGTGVLALGAEGVRRWEDACDAAAGLPGLPAWLRETCADLARSAGVYLLSGTALVPQDGGVRHEAWLFAPDGSLVGTQAQTHLTPHERALGLIPGDDLAVFPTPVGDIGILIQTDLWIPEACRILALRGATLLLAPVAVPAPYPEAHQVRGLWQQVQQNQIFGVECGLSGELLGVPYRSRPAVCAPCEMTEGESGWLARGEDGQALSAVVDYRALQAAVDRYDIFARFNYRLYERYLPAIYEHL